mgnify:CR=1 FL=1
MMCTGQIHIHKLTTSYYRYRVSTYFLNSLQGHYLGELCFFAHPLTQIKVAPILKDFA